MIHILPHSQPGSARDLQSPPGSARVRQSSTQGFTQGSTQEFSPGPPCTLVIHTLPAPARGSVLVPRTRRPQARPAYSESPSGSGTSGDRACAFPPGTRACVQVIGPSAPLKQGASRPKRKPHQPRSQAKCTAPMRLRRPPLWPSFTPPPRPGDRRWRNEPNT